MSHNIRSVRYIGVGRLHMRSDVRAKLAETLFLPEISFIEDDACYEGDCLKQICWSGEGSGRGEQDLYKALSSTTGRASLVLTWESGSFSGVRVCDGKVTHHEVVITLGDEL